MPKSHAAAAASDEVATDDTAVDSLTVDDGSVKIPEIEMDGQKYKAEFSYETFAVLRKKFGEDPDMMNPEVLAVHALQAIKKNHPMVTLEQIMAVSPPMVPVGRAVRTAMNRLFWGDKPPPSSAS